MTAAFIDLFNQLSEAIDQQAGVSPLVETRA
jgi:hypothetical protein